MTKIGLRLWLILGYLIPTTLLSVFCVGYFSYVSYNGLAISLTNQAKQIAQPLAINSQHLLSQNNYELLQQLLNSHHRLNSTLISNISLISSDNTLILSTNPQQINEKHYWANPSTLQLSGEISDADNSLLFYQPLHIDNQANSAHSSAYLVLQLQPNLLQMQQHGLLLNSLLVLLACFIIASLICWYLTRGILRPVLQLKQQVQQLLAGNTSALNLNMLQELSIIQHGLNELGNVLENQEHEMQLQIEQSISDLQQSMELLEINNIQLDLAKRKAQEENRQKSEFLAKMSHELRTPLNAVIGFSRQLLKTQLSTNQHDYLTTIQKSANNLLHLVNDVLDFAKLEDGRLSINAEPFSLKDVINDAVELLAANAFDKQLELVHIIEPDCPDDLIADSGRLVQVIMNLAGNAIKFTDHGSIIIHMSATQLNDAQVMLHCSVQDTGRGISEEQQKMLFNGFTTQDPNSHQSGSGLGLMISQRLVKALGGNIGFESKLGEGTTFWFTMKCQRHNLPIADSLPLDVLDKKHILYYEPQQHSREATLSLLQQWGLQVTACANKLQLQESLCENTHYDIALLGATVTTHKLNQTIDLLQQVKPYSDNCFLLVNTLSPAIRDNLVRAGATACLSKPSHTTKLALALCAPYTQLTTSIEPITKPESTHLHVLTVDDNEANLKLINTLLSEQVDYIDSAKDGAEAWHKSTLMAYDIIFMDINMPVMDGISSCKQIRENSLNRHTPIIAVTAHAIEGERERLLSLGFNEFLTKPLDEKILQNTLLTFCVNCPSTLNAVPRSTFPESKLVDWLQALERANGKPSIMFELLNMLVASLPSAKEAINLALDAKDAQLVLQHIHKLHGACCYTAIPRLNDLANLLETQLKQAVSLDALEPEFFELNDVLDAILEESKSWAI